MKKLTIITAFCALILGGCAENNLDGITPEENTVTLPDLTAGFADEECTKTYVEEDKYLRWHEDDRITAFYGNTLNRQYKFKGVTGDNSGTFSLVPSGELGTGNDLEAIYAIYPYDDNSTITDKGEISLTLPAVQTYTENSFGRGANTMIAVTENLEDTFLAFKNSCGYLKLKLYGDNVTLASIEVKGNNNERIAGAATATIAFGGAPQLTMADEATTTITLDCGEGATLGATAEAATEFWVVIPETTFENGITITITDTEGSVFEKSTSNSVAITRNDIQPMAALRVIIEKTESPTPSVPNIPNNEIWYTATAKVEPDINVQFGAGYLSSTWNETTGEGVLFFDGDVTMIEGNALWCSEYLTSITLPQSVNTVSGAAFGGLRNLSKFEGKFASEDGHCLIVDGVLVSIACAGLSEYRLPDNIHSIADFGCDCMWFNGFERLIVPGCVETIGRYAFAESPAIKEIILEEGVKYIGDNAFGAIGVSSKVVLPSTISTIGSYVFYGNLNLYLYATTPPTINSDTFPSYDNLNIYLPAKCIPNYISYVDYNDEKYKNWFNLLPYIKGSIESPEFNNSSEIANNEIRYQTYDGYICPPFFSDESDWGANIVAHRYNDTLGCWVIQFDDEVEQVCDNAFFYPSGRQSRLNNITLPNSITRIGKQAFVINNLESVTIPESVTIIDDEAFNEIGDLSVIYCKPIVPPTIGNNAFRKWDGYDLNIYVPAQSEVDYKREWLALSPYIYPYNFE